MPTLHLLRVFCAEDGSGGNPLGVFLRGRRGAAGAAPGRRRRPRPERDRLRRRRRARRDPHLHAGRRARLRRPPDGRDGMAARRASTALRPPAGEVPVRREGEDVYVAARPEWGPPHELIQLELSRRGGGARRPAGGARPRDGLGVDRRGRRDRPRARVSRADRDSRGRGHRLSRDEAVRACSDGRSTSARAAARASSPDPARTGSWRSAAAASSDEVRDYALP